ncbi:MAG: alpha/beta hydrolase [Gemmataceae bacterium]|nr:alpha/beta hydrolase [Gemmata sp.]MDW8198224.1 alpha/beta hydrolase [Gemmataceae bacterium]
MMASAVNTLCGLSLRPDVTDTFCHEALTAFDRYAVADSFTTRRYRLRYVVWSRPAIRGHVPLVIIHGLADAARGLAMVMYRLVEQMPCIAYELPNGLDDGASLGSYRHQHYVDDLVALLDHLKVDRVVLMGSSFGTTIALAALAQYPQRFPAGVLKSAFAYRPLRWYERLGARQGRYWSGRLCELPWRQFALRWADPATWAGCSPLARQLFLYCNGQTPIRAACRRALLLDRLDLRPLLKAIRTPILLIGGDRDGIVPRRYEAVLEAGLPDVRRVELADCGHYPQYTHPIATAHAIRTFLQKG